MCAPRAPAPAWCAGADAFLLESIFRNEVWEHMQLPISEDNERACYQVGRRGGLGCFLAQGTSLGCTQGGAQAGLQGGLRRPCCQIGLVGAAWPGKCTRARQ